MPESIVEGGERERTERNGGRRERERGTMKLRLEICAEEVLGAATWGMYGLGVSQFLYALTINISSTTKINYIIQFFQKNPHLQGQHCIHCSVQVSFPSQTEVSLIQVNDMDII